MEEGYCVICGKEITSRPRRFDRKTCGSNCSREYQKRYRKTKEYRAYATAYQNIYRKALYTLARRHKKEFKEIVKQVKKEMY